MNISLLNNDQVQVTSTKNKSHNKKLLMQVSPPSEHDTTGTTGFESKRIFYFN